MNAVIPLRQAEPSLTLDKLVDRELPLTEIVEALKRISADSRYTPVAPLGQGSNAVTIQMRDEELSLPDEPFYQAIKFDLPTPEAEEQRVDRDRPIVRGIRSEARLGHTKSDHIITGDLMYFNTTHGPLEAIKMPECEQTLEDKLGTYVRHNKGLTTESISKILNGMARGLCDLHTRAKSIHGDLTPQNIGIDDDKATLMDLGTGTRVLGIDKRQRKNMGAIYTRAPERFRNERLDYTSDVYSFGAIALRMFTGNYPLQDCEDRDALDHETFRGELKADLKKVPRKYHALVKRCLDPEACKRPYNGRVLLEQLKKAEATSVMDVLRSPVIANSIKAAPWLAFVSTIAYVTATTDTTRKPEVQTLSERLYVANPLTVDSWNVSRETLELPSPAFGGFVARPLQYEKNFGKHTSFLLAAQYNAALAGGGAAILSTDYQINLLESTHTKEQIEKGPVGKFLFAAANAIEYHLSHIEPEANVDLEDLLFTIRNGKNVLERVKHASGSEDFADYITARNPDGTYIVSEDEQFMMRAWLTEVR